MGDSLALAAVGVIGVVLGAASVLAFRISERSQSTLPPQPESPVPPGVNAVLSTLRSSAVVVDADDSVLKASAPAHALGLVRGNRLVVSDLLDMVRAVRRDGELRESDLTIEHGGGRPATYLAARVAPLGSRLVLVLVEDQTRERRVEAIRRDFVANVSHELKTPIGALTLLAEAVGEAADDPDAVRRFSGRMQTESERLSRLVQQIIELSRLQGDDPIDSASPVPLDEVVDAALDRSRVDAQTKSIELARGGQRGLTVMGNADQITLALGNLVENAIAYSEENTRVVVSAKEGESGGAELTVTDQGVGIPQHELDRIFERFYRVDPARSRSTGGTGLGLSIVKHVAATHGGEVRVWSVEGEGSSFTLCLPGSTSHGGTLIQRPTADPGSQSRPTQASGSQSQASGSQSRPAQASGPQSRSTQASESQSRRSPQASVNEPKEATT